jgi:hypothetical protein
MTRAGVALLVVGMICATAALVPAAGVAAGAEAPITVLMPPEPPRFNFAVSPKRLPVGAETPATLRLQVDESPNVDGSGWIGISAATIGLDKSISLNADSSPTCGRRLLEADFELEDRVPTRCKRAIVGRSEARVFDNPPEQIGLKDPASGTIYNGGTRGGVTHLIVELSFEPPGKVAFMTVLIGRGATTKIPQIDEGFGALFEFRLELNREGFVTAECPTGKLSTTLAATFRDGTKAQTESIRACSR